MTTASRHSMPQQTLRPFASEPGRWAREVQRARRRLPAAARGGRCAAPGESSRREELTRIHERTDWGWIRWQVPIGAEASGGPWQIAVLSPAKARTVRLASRWLTRRPPLRIYFDTRRRFWVTGTTVLAAVVSLLLAGAAMGNGLPADVGLPLMLLVPVLVDHLPGRLDARASAHVRVVQDGSQLQEFERFVVLHRSIHTSGQHTASELTGAVRLGHHLLWDAAGLLGQPAVRVPQERLKASERLLAQLAGHPLQAQSAVARRSHRWMTRPTTSSSPRCLR
ncbi:hypothetical protein ACFWXK_10310 [Streptomyces sp. NPDC059070]|uniref:hypothetical protein n=1 Tax=Streptomyces sp. NPDC059070 TaxID=3346713 RepID=UPI00368EB391